MLLTTKTIPVFNKEEVKPGSFITFRYMEYEFDDSEDTPVVYPIVKEEVNGIIDTIYDTTFVVWSLKKEHRIEIGDVSYEHPSIIITGIQPKVDWI